ncbi:MAG: RNA polymerase sigma factor [Terracidiphilus sp.]|jgi:RNA polymerase sigma-70 factor (ECF subfamily)
MNSSEGFPVAACTVTLPLTDLSRLFGEHHRRVLTAAYRITGNMSDAEDVAQAVFLRLASSGLPVTNAGSYLYRAAINGALDLLRRRKSAQTEPLEFAEYVAAGSGSSPEAEASSRELGALLRIAIGELPPRAAEMFILRYVEEHGNREIAAMMGTSQAVVAVTLFNARAKLKRRLSGYERGK